MVRNQLLVILDAFARALTTVGLKPLKPPLMVSYQSPLVSRVHYKQCLCSQSVYTDSVDSILERFEDAGEFTPSSVIALLSAHSIATQNDIDPTVSGAPFDSTPEILDGQFFIETLLKGIAFIGQTGIEGVVESPISGEFRLQSDHDVGCIDHYCSFVMS